MTVGACWCSDNTIQLSVETVCLLSWWPAGKMRSGRAAEAAYIRWAAVATASPAPAPAPAAALVVDSSSSSSSTQQYYRHINSSITNNNNSNNSYCEPCWLVLMTLSRPGSHDASRAAAGRPPPPAHRKLCSQSINFYANTGRTG